MDKRTISECFRGLQDRISKEVETLDGGKGFKEDSWNRDEGGGGRSRVMENGRLLEKGGVNFSEVYGKLFQELSERLNVEAGGDFYATGVSLVFHGWNPYLPIIHMNVRYFELEGGTCWFGGGIDLTPIYVDPEEAIRFHQALKEVCDRHDSSFYPRFKEWADTYFYIPHREETRGIGGIFFDHLRPADDLPVGSLFSFVQDVGEGFIPIYRDIVSRKRDMAYGDRELQWRDLRRGRYVEFNLVYDRGTRFGLQSGGRTESILMTLPRQAAWYYDHQPETGSDEKRTLDWLRKGIDWVDEGR